MEDDKKIKGRICVTGGTGFIGSWIVKRLLEDGYSVNATTRIDPGDEQRYTILKRTTMVHIDDVARAHIHLFEHPNAKGRYLCTGVEISIEEICEFISAKYPEYQLPTADSLKDVIPFKFSNITSKKLVETGFKFENGLAEMLDGAIKCCKEKDYV